jgi:hypothetical protein
MGYPAFGFPGMSIMLLYIPFNSGLPAQIILETTALE